MKFRNFLLFAFAISGMTALIYEVVWGRSLQFIFGSTIYAVSTILTTFFLGFALGSYLFRNMADNKNSTKLFSLIQIGIGFYGLLLIYLFKILPQIYLNLLESEIIKFSLVFLVLIIPATLFGGIWPVTYKAYLDINKFGKDAGVLYSINSLGAFIGSIGAGFLLIPLLGITKTIIFAVILNFFSAGLIYFGGKNEN